VSTFTVDESAEMYAHVALTNTGTGKMMNNGGMASYALDVACRCSTSTLLTERSTASSNESASSKVNSFHCGILWLFDACHLMQREQTSGPSTLRAQKEHSSLASPGNESLCSAHIENA